MKSWAARLEIDERKKILSRKAKSDLPEEKNLGVRGENENGSENEHIGQRNIRNREWPPHRKWNQGRRTETRTGKMNLRAEPKSDGENKIGLSVLWLAAAGSLVAAYSRERQWLPPWPETIARNKKRDEIEARNKKETRLNTLRSESSNTSTK
jgi:hypothetical protein